MPTTKKAAPKSVRAKKTNIRKRVPKKNTAGAGRMLVAKKTLPSRIAKLKIKDKTGDGALKQNKIEHKLLTIESLHAKKNPSLTSKLAKPRSSSKMPYGTFARHAKHGGQVAALALLSPYRFPVDTHKLAVATARYSGVFFVAVGAFFTVWLADISLGSQALQATVVTTDSSYSNTGNESGGSNSSTGSIDCTKADNYFNTYCETVVDQKPPADISVNNASELTGSVQIKINVPFADSVTLMAYDRTQTRTITLGNATKVSSDVWEMYWRTTDYDDGDYKLKALIKNGYGTYESVDDVYTTVANAVLTESVSSTAGETAEATTTDAAYGSTEDRSGETANTDTLVDARVSVTGSLNLTEFKMEVEARTAEKVKIYAQKQGSTNKSLLGYAYQENENLWKYRWLPASTEIGRAHV